MGTTTRDYEKDCPCGKGKLLIEFSENDSVWGPHWERERVIRVCAACGNDVVPKEDPEAEKAATAEIWRRFREDRKK